MKLKINNYKIGMVNRKRKKITYEDVVTFANLSGDVNPIHLDDDYAKKSIFGEKVVHGMLVASLISRIIGNELPGNGSIYLSQNLRFLKPVKIDDYVTAEVKISKIDEKTNIIYLDTRCYKDDNTNVIIGEASVLLR